MSTETKVGHTPGPWEVEDGRPTTCGGPRIKADGVGVCDCFGVEGFGGTTAGNARLIAAAPLRCAVCGLQIEEFIHSFGDYIACSAACSNIGMDLESLKVPQ